MAKASTKKSATVKNSTDVQTPSSKPKPTKKNFVLSGWKPARARF